MGSDSRKAGEGEEQAFGPDTIERVIRDRVRATIETIVREELDAALGAARSARIGAQRCGYRHGTRPRTLTTSLGPTTIAMPRARVRGTDGTVTEWQSQTVPRYQRRTARVDEAILGVYLSGGNTRRLKGALAPLLRGGPLGKDAVSRLVGRLAADFEAWRQRELSTENIRYLFLDGWYPCVRIAKRRERVPILVILGVRGNGVRIVLDMRVVGQETTAAWEEAVEGLAARGLRAPVLAVIDGSPGLRAALRTQWPAIAIGRCAVHKLRNLLAKAPARLREELAEDYRRMIYGETRELVERRARAS